MKTNPSARGIRRVRAIIVCAALAAIVGFELYATESLAARIGQTTARQTDSPAPLDVSISDLMAAAR